MRLTKTIKSILLHVACGSSYDSEYDGRMYQICAFCDAQLSEGEKHSSDCLMTQARAELGDVWDAHLMRKESEKRKYETLKREPWNSAECDLCGQMVNPCNLKNHRDSKNCKKQQNRNQPKAQS